MQNVLSLSELDDIFSKSLNSESYDTSCDKLGMFDMYAPIQGSISGFSLNISLFFFSYMCISPTPFEACNKKSRVS